MPAAPDSSTLEPDVPHPHADENGVDSAPDGSPAPATVDACSAQPRGSGGPAVADACGNRGEAGTETESAADLAAQVARLQDDLLRKQADFENARKRLIRDKEEAIKFANSALLVDLTAILDDFERAISASANGRDFGTLYSGIELIEKQLLATLERKWGLARFDSAGQPFDPERHEALATEPSTEYREATVLEDYQKGYTLHGRVIRAARVRVATPVEEAADGAATAGDVPDPRSDPDGSG